MWNSGGGTRTGLGQTIKPDGSLRPTANRAARANETVRLGAMTPDPSRAGSDPGLPISTLGHNPAEFL